MTLRSFVSFLILANYLLLAVMGCISTPEDDSYMVILKAGVNQSHRYEEIGYLRMDGIEEFMAEAMADTYKKIPDSHDHLVLSVISGVDTHFLPDYLQIQPSTFRNEKPVEYHYTIPPAKDRVLAIYSPPDGHLYA